MNTPMEGIFFCPKVVNHLMIELLNQKSQRHESFSRIFQCSATDKLFNSLSGNLCSLGNEL